MSVFVVFGFVLSSTEVSELQFNVSFQHKYGYIRDDSSTETSQTHVVN